MLGEPFPLHPLEDVATDDPMTVGGLIAVLQRFPAETPVHVSAGSRGWPPHVSARRYGPDWHLRAVIHASG